MAWFWGFFILVVLAGSLWVGYADTEKMLGREAAIGMYRYRIPAALFGSALAFMILLFGKYGWVNLSIFQILCTVGISAWWISWFFRKRKAGALLINIERSSQSKSILWLGLFEVAVAIFQTWSVFMLATDRVPKYTSLEPEISKLVYWWFSASFFVAIGLDKFELRENGICRMYSLTKWQRISSYAWDVNKSNVLTIRLKPRFLLGKGFMSMAIPEKHKHMVNHILDKQLSGKSL